VNSYGIFALQLHLGPLLITLPDEAGSFFVVDGCSLLAPFSGIKASRMRPNDIQLSVLTYPWIRGDFIDIEVSSY
jgi:hypothetical protein